MGETGRRTVLAMSAGSVAALVGCQVYGPPGQAEAPLGPPATPAPAGSSPNGTATAETPDTQTPETPDEPGSAVGTPLVGAGDVAVGGGVILAEANLVVTQPAEGEFKAFSATCTHQGCAVSEVADGTINCNCHGSKFAVADGSVVSGPAGSPLPETEIVVDGGTIGLP